MRATLTVEAAESLAATITSILVRNDLPPPKHYPIPACHPEGSFLVTTRYLIGQGVLELVCPECGRLLCQVPLPHDTERN